MNRWREVDDCLGSRAAGSRLGEQSDRANSQEGGGSGKEAEGGIILTERSEDRPLEICPEFLLPFQDLHSPFRPERPHGLGHLLAGVRSPNRFRPPLNHDVEGGEGARPVTEHQVASAQSEVRLDCVAFP